MLGSASVTDRLAMGSSRIMHLHLRKPCILYSNEHSGHSRSLCLGVDLPLDWPVSLS